MRQRIEQLFDSPDLGLASLPESIVGRYGEGARKLVVDLFIVVYEFGVGSDAVDVLALMHQRVAW